MLLCITFFIILMSTFFLLSAPKIVSHWKLNISQIIEVNDFFKRQLLGLIVAFTVTMIALIARGNLFLQIGDIHRPPQPIAALGINSDSTWFDTAIEISLTLVVVTCLFLLVHLRKERPLAKFKIEYLFWAILFALTNSLTEELIFRFAIINLLHEQINPMQIAIISAIAFGLPHYKGMPNGILGVMMASFLGFILARSVMETQGLAIAWALHFILDIPIIITLFWTSKLRPVKI